MGFTLFEVLISLFILSMMLLGLDAMQVISLQKTISAYYYNAAIQQINSMTAYLIVTKGKVTDEMVNKWNQQNQEMLPQGRGMVEGNCPHFRVSIFWGKPLSAICNSNQIGKEGCVKLEVNL